MDYLEKIFHVPFQLPPMGDDGFKDLVEHLAAPASVDASASIRVKQDAATNSEVKEDAESELQPGVLGEPTTTDIAKKDEIQSPKPKAEPQPAQAKSERHMDNVELVGSVPLEKWEADALKQFASLIRTPRSVTRFLNTYRLIRAGIHKEKWPDFKGDGLAKGEFRIAMLLLAAAAGYPAIAREWFRAIRSANVGAFVIAEGTVGPDDVAWKAFRDHYVGVFASGGSDKKNWEHWLAAVERFAF